MAQVKPSSTTKKKNICSTQDDLFCRYKRDVIEVEYQSKCGGQPHCVMAERMVQTKLLNIETIAKQLRLSSDVILRLMQQHLHQRVKPKHILSGKIPADVIETVLDKIIKDQVLCSNCGLPELNEKRVCQACGQ